MTNTIDELIEEINLLKNRIGTTSKEQSMIQSNLTLGKPIDEYLYPFVSVIFLSDEIEDDVIDRLKAFKYLRELSIYSYKITNKSFEILSNKDDFKYLKVVNLSKYCISHLDISILENAGIEVKK